MSKKTIWVIVVCIIIVIAAIALAYHASHQTVTNTNPAPSDTGLSPDQSAASAASTTAETSYTLTQVAEHDNAESCWTAINGGVYDVTNWINQHPGGPQAILSLCGKDGSAAFNQQHGGQAQPAAELVSFKIGTLSQ